MTIWLKYRFHFLLILAALATYANTWTHDYAWDDSIVITANERVQAGWDRLNELWINFRTNEIQGRYGYRPITLFTFATEIEFFGLDPFWGHLTNTLLYALLGIVLFLNLNKIFPQLGQPILFWAVLIFLVHPIHTEVVANIKSRDEILALLFGFLALGAYWDFLSRKNWTFLIPAVLWAVLSFLSKENGVTITGVMLLLAFHKFHTNPKSQLMRTLPALGILALLIGIRLWSFSEEILHTDWRQLEDQGNFLENQRIGNPIVALGSWWLILPNSIFLTGLYLQKFLIPHPLIHDYSFNQLELVGWESPVVWLLLTGLIAGLYFAIKNLKNGSVVGWSYLFFLITISIFLHFLVPGTDIFGERFLFMPSVGLCLILTLGIKWVAEKLSFARLIPVSMGVLCFTFLLLSFNRNSAWANTRQLIETDLPKLENCARAHYNYASILHNDYYQAVASEKETLKNGFFRHYEKSLEITDHIFKAHLDLGAAYMEFGMPQKALPIFEKARNIFPDLAAPYFELGRYHFSLEQFPEAGNQFLIAIEKGKANVSAYYYCSLSFVKQNKIEQAQQILHRGLEWQPTFPDYYLLAAKLELATGNVQNALEVLETAQIKFPDETVIYQTLINICDENHLEKKLKEYNLMAQKRNIQLN